MAQSIAKNAVDVYTSLGYKLAIERSPFSMVRKALITLVAGKKYQKSFATLCYAGWKAYADRYGLDLVILDTLPDQSPRGLSRSPAWQKCLALAGKEAMRYQQVAWLDADIAINPESAPDIFATVRPHQIGAVADYSYPTKEAFRSRLDNLYRRWDALGLHYIDNKTPELFMQAWGLPPLKEVVQTGVIVVNPELHAPLLHKTYDTYEDKPGFNYEMRPLSYEILTNTEIAWLDIRFNVVIGFGVLDSELDLYLQEPGLIERVSQKLSSVHTPMLFARNRNLVRVYRRLFHKSFFLHFAGRQQDMSLLKYI